MELVILHYHLNRGGVTRVVANHLRALGQLGRDAAPKRVTIIYGGRAVGWDESVTQELAFPVQLSQIPDLDYDEQSDSNVDRLHAALQSVLAEFDSDSTVLHIHNHSLGKNRALPPTVVRLAQSGWRQLLQIHDFAEDLRPENYQRMLQSAASADQLQRELYPQGPRIHYAVLNQRDQEILRRAGIAAERLHLLPNAVLLPSTRTTARESAQAKARLFELRGVSPQKKYVLYPVRAIRRKNVGEVLLWSLLGADVTFGVTLAPLNPSERQRYETWVELAKALRLPVLFDVGGVGGLSFEENYAAADAIITTSVAEGFGLVYLEANLAARHLVGRSLPGITDDFLAAGMRFPGLAASFRIPAQIIDIDHLQRKHVALARELNESYGLPAARTADLEESIAASFSGDHVDFGRLDWETQQNVVRKVSSEADLRATLRELNPHVRSLTDVNSADLQGCIAENRRVIEQQFSLEVTSRILNDIYRSILAAGAGQVGANPEIARTILQEFVRSDRLIPIRLEA